MILYVLASAISTHMFYIPDVKAALKDVWYAGNEVCAELLYPLIGEYIDILQRDGMWTHS